MDLVSQLKIIDSSLLRGSVKKLLSLSDLRVPPSHILYHLDACSRLIRQVFQIHIFSG